MLNSKSSVTIAGSLISLAIFLVLAYIGIAENSPVVAGLVSGGLIALTIKLASKRIERLEDGK